MTSQAGDIYRYLLGRGPPRLRTSASRLKATASASSSTTTATTLQNTDPARRYGLAVHACCRGLPLMQRLTLASTVARHRRKARILNKLRARANASTRAESSNFSLNEICDEWARGSTSEGAAQPSYVSGLRWQHWLQLGLEAASRMAGLRAYKNIYPIPLTQLSEQHKPQTEPWLHQLITTSGVRATTLLPRYNQPNKQA